MRFLSRRPTVGILCLIAILVVSSSRAGTYYVSTGGSDANAGTASSPWRTLQKAANSVRSGDVVLVANGTYSGFNMTADGTSSAPIVFRATGNNVVVNAPNSSTPDNINIEGGDYVTIDGFVVNNAPRVGIRAVLATGVAIRNNVVTGSGLTGILTGYTPRIEISGNITSNSQQQHGIYISNSTSASDNPIVRGNESYGNKENGIQLNGDCDVGGDGVISGALIENNVVHHNQWKGFSLISVQNSIIRNNIIYENGLTAGAGGIHLADQPGCGKPSNNNVVVNNTIHEPRITGIRTSNNSAGNTIFNNLVVASSLARTIVDEDGGNFIDPTSNMLLTSTAGLFQSVGVGNYDLALLSPAIDRAASAYHGVSGPPTDVDGTPRPQGLKLDTGAYEHSSATGVGDTPPIGVVLDQNSPNPFGTTTQIAYDLPSPMGERVSLGIFDIRGRRVRTLVEANRPSRGRAVVAWDGRDDVGNPVPSGVYFYRLSVGKASVTRRMTLLK